MASDYQGGAHIATVDDVAYYRVDWVVRDAGDGRWPHYYCDAANWPTTPVGKLAARDEEIRVLEQQLAARDEAIRVLEQQLAAHTVPPVVAAAATGMPTASEAERPGAKGRVVCPDCGKKLWPNALATHICTPPDPPTAETDPLDLAEQLAPSRPPRHEPQLPPAEPPPIQFDGWRCAICSSDTHAQSVADPTVCVRCAKVRTNGHAVAA